MELNIYQVDVFTKHLFSGNPAAIVPLNEWLPENTMQAIAFENNLSETAFFVPDSTKPYELRWFTPTSEVVLCGHATLASGFIIMTQLEPNRSEVAFLTQSGVLQVRRIGNRFQLDLPARRAFKEFQIKEVAPLLTKLPVSSFDIIGHETDLLIFQSEEEIRQIEVNFDAIKKRNRSLLVTAPGDSVDFVSRYFAPHRGVPEDPVTGSAHCALTPYWSKKLGKKCLSAQQLSERGGDLECEDQGDRIWITGEAKLYLSGKIMI